MILTTTATPDLEPVDIESARKHLRLFSTDLDTDIAGKLEAAREWCESYVSRTLRSEVTRTYKLATWGRGPIYLPYPPILGVTSITYQDADDVEQTLDAGNYHVVTTTESIGWVEWAFGSDLPSPFDRPDAVSITYTAGYGSNAAVPQKAKQAILLYLDVLWGDSKAKDLTKAEESAKSLLSACDWGIYS